MNNPILNARIKINGDGELREYMQTLQQRLRRLVPKTLLKIMFQAINITKEDYLTDPGRIYGRWRTRPDGRRYREVLNYPRPKIGVLTGRLRQSYGATTRDGIRQITNNGFKIRIGTNVEYAPYVARRKYDFAEKGLHDVEIRGFLSDYIYQLLEELVNE